MTIKKTSTGWLVNIQPGGREGRRIRRTFRLKETAEAFKRNQLSQAERLEVGQSVDMTVCDLIDRFDKYAQTQRGYKLSERYRIAGIRRYFEPNNKSITQIRLSDGLTYETQRKLEGKSTWTIYREIGTFKRIFTWAVGMDYLPFSPFEKKWKRKQGKGRIRWLTSAEQATILTAAHKEDPELAKTIFVGLQTGFRLGNLERLEAAHIGATSITAHQTKSDSPYDVPISLALLPLIQELKSRTGFVLDTKNFADRFRALMQRLGFYKSKGDPQKVTVHTLRHSFAAYWLGLGVPIYTVSKWMGHSTVAMTEKIYGHLCKEYQINQMREAESRIGRQSVDTQIIPFPQTTSESIGVDGIRTRGLCLDSE